MNTSRDGISPACLSNLFQYLNALIAFSPFQAVVLQLTTYFLWILLRSRKAGSHTVWNNPFQHHNLHLLSLLLSLWAAAFLLNLISLFKAFSRNSGCYISAIITFSLCSSVSPVLWFPQDGVQFMRRKIKTAERHLPKGILGADTFPHTPRCTHTGMFYSWADFPEPTGDTKWELHCRVGKCCQQLPIQVKKSSDYRNTCFTQKWGKC